MKRIIACLLCLTYITGSAQTRINADEATKHIGDSVSVCGKVYGSAYLKNSKGQPILTNMGAAYPNSPFTAVIFDKARAMFTNAPETYHKDSIVCITGRVVLYNGKPQIVINKPSQISIN